MDTVQGRQGLAKSQQNVRDVSIRFAASDQESRRDERFLHDIVVTYNGESRG